VISGLSNTDKRLTQGREMTAKERLSFRWSYIIAPLIVFLLSIILSAYFYHLLPAEVAVRFEPDGIPNKWLSREMTMVCTLLPQLFFVLLAGGVAWGVIQLDRRFGWAKSGIVRAGRIVSFMGNILALPQLILLFAMLDILSYNSYQTHILSMWLFLIVILGLATVALLVLAIFILLRARRAMSQPDE
jgi:uncharacterized membrane protein